MINNRYLETIKRLLNAEAYFRSPRKVDDGKSEPPQVREDKAK